jgi:hypothetical protein
MIIMLDADKTVIKTKDLIKGKDQVEKVQRTRDGNYTLLGTRKSLLTEHEDKPVTRITFIGHSAYEEGTGVQCYGGYEVEDFSDLLIARLKEANESSGKKNGFTDNLTHIDLIGCFTGYVSPTGKSFAGRVAERLLEAGFNIRVNAFTNRGLAKPHAVSSMISMPSIEEGKLYIRGFSSPAKQEKYNQMKEVIAKAIEKKEYKGCELAELIEKFTAKKKEKKEAEEKHTLAKNEMAKMQGRHDSLTKEIKALEEKLNAHNAKEFSSEKLQTSIESVVDYAKKSKSKWQDKAVSLAQEIGQINSSQQSEQEKSSAMMEAIERTVKDIRSHFFGGRRSTTASALQDVMDNKENVTSFSSLKSLLNTIEQDAIDNNSKWKNKTRDLLLKINAIDQSKDEKSKLREALALIDLTAKDIRGHFFGGSGSTIATRLEKILEKQDKYFAHAKEQEALNRELLQKKSELEKLKTSPRIKVLKEEDKRLTTSLEDLDKDMQSLRQQAKGVAREIKILDKQINEDKKKMVSFAVEVACTDNVRHFLDSHPECNFTQSAQEKQLKSTRVIRNSGRVGFFQPPTHATDTTVIAPLPTTKI